MNHQHHQHHKQPFSCLAIDMGAASIRIVQGIFGEQLVLREVYRFNNPMEKRDGVERWNLQSITTGILYGIRKAIRETDFPIESIGTDSWGVDFVQLGKDGQPLEDPVSYRDERTLGMREKWNRLMDEQETFQRTGINYNVFNTLYQLLSLKGSQTLVKTSRILFMADYINYFLSGMAVNEITLASTSQLINCGTKIWDTRITGLLDLPSSVFSPPVQTGTSLGFCKKYLKINKQVRVMAVAGHDTACAFAAVPFESENAAFLSTGTWCIMGWLSEKPLLSEEAYRMGVTNEIAANGQFRPVKNMMGLWLIQQLRLAFGEIHSYDEIDRMAANAKTSGFHVNTDDPGFYHPEDMKVAFDHFFEKHNQPLPSGEAAYYRCAFDSLARSFRKTLLDFEALRGKPFDAVHLIGGGSKSALLCQLTANVLQKRVLAGPAEGAVTGNLLIQYEALKKDKSFGSFPIMPGQSGETVVYNPVA